MILPSPLRKTLIALAGSLSLGGPALAAPVESIPYAKAEPGSRGSSLFTRLGPETTHLDVSRQLLDWHPAKRLYSTAFASGCIALGDLDGDGLTDVFVSGGPGSSKIYLQTGRLMFVDVTAALRINDGGFWASGAVLVDIDNDSDLDLYICYYDQPNKLYVNDLHETGRLSFAEKAHSFGLDIKDASLVAAFADYDCDGDLDLYLVTHQLVREGGRPSSPVKLEKSPTGDQLRISGELSRYYELDDPTGVSQNLQYHETGRPDFLFRNDKGQFHDVTHSAGINPSPFVGNSAIWWDADSDGYPDLYVGNDGPDPNLFYHNNRNGTFTLQSKNLPRTPVYSRGTALLDADEDGLTDLFVTDLLPDTHFKRQITRSPLEDGPAARWRQTTGAPQALGNALFLQTPGGNFREAARLYGLAATGWTSSVKPGDFDQDGHEDLFFATGAIRNFKMADLPRPTHERLTGKTLWDIYEATAPEKRELSRVYRKSGETRFEEVSRNWGLSYKGVTQACALGDLDNDGDLDLAVCCLEEPLTIYRNDGPGGNSVRIRLRGTQGNARGIGARICLTTSSGKQVRELRCGGGFMDGDEPSLHFGIGRNPEIAGLEVIWPGGNRQRFSRLAANRIYTLTEEKSPSPKSASAPSGAVPMFSPHSALNAFRHNPAASNDFTTQPLLPFSLSATGPAQAWGDVDGDGDLDLRLGQTLLLNQSNPATGEIRFEPKSERSLEQDPMPAEGGSVFLDADSDGDLDLYVASGASDPSSDTKTLQDRLLFNWERGVLGQELRNLPDTRESTFAISAADFDQDGDTDFFAGGRTRPGHYPLPSRGFLYVNERATFHDASAELAPALAECGPATSSVWTDLDNDGWLDLVISRQLGSIEVFKNQKGHLAPAKDTGLEAFEGFWNGVAAADLNQDGNMDLIATNLGLNTPYQAAPGSPALLFFGTFGGVEQPRLVEALLEDGVCFPRRNLTDLAAIFPSLAEKWKSHRDFASAPLNQIFPLFELQSATLKKADELRSGVFWNDGKAHFHFTPLPASAQLAPAFGVAIADVNLDGAPDLFLAQNFTPTRPGLGPFRGGIGTLLRNIPNAKTDADRFQTWSAEESGIAIPGDARSAAFVDVNGDHFPDLVAGVHRDAPALFLHRGKAENLPFAVTLRGLPGNPTAIGARIQVKAPGMPLQTREVQAGAGYLTSIHGGPLLFARSARPPSGEIDVLVRWPSGEKKSFRFPSNTPDVSLQ